MPDSSPNDRFELLSIERKKGYASWFTPRGWIVFNNIEFMDGMVVCCQPEWDEIKQALADRDREIAELKKGSDVEWKPVCPVCSGSGSRLNIPSSYDVSLVECSECKGSGRNAQS